jgi:hypothetical protein
MATPNRCTVTIDGTKVPAVSASVTASTPKDNAGMPQMGGLQTNITVVVDMHDDNAVPNATLQKLFNLANVATRDKIKDMKIEYWKDDSMQDALCSWSFKGWISRFQTSNPVANGQDGGLNHVLIMDLEPSNNSQNIKDLKFGN